MGVRKNLRSLTTAEKTEFVNAVRALKANGRYNQYVLRHAQAPMANIHRSPAFLPWHRQFILDFERELQQVSGNPNLALPYWNWTEDAGLPDPRTAPIWADNFMGGNGDPGNNWAVRSGPFRPGEWTIVDGNGNAAGALRRQFGINVPTLPSLADVNNVLSTTPYDASPWNMTSNPSFRNRLEGWYPVTPGLHNRVHVWVGGSMIPMTSPNDPVFFLHHCFVDKLWADWQARFPNQSYQPIAGGPQRHNLNDMMERTLSGSVTPASVLNIRTLDYSYDTDPVVRQLAQSMWIHGHSLQIESVDRVRAAWRIGPLISIEGGQNTENWFHFAIPTPVIVNDRRLRAGAVLLRFKTISESTFVHAVHIYDGESRLTGYDNLRLSPRNWTSQRFDVPNDPEIRWGLGISIGVRFQSANPVDNRIEFSSAGGEFLS
ncbi:MAG: tyrosinase family protein [Anaerolineae bacterium]|nr:tyrosinase family protein [Anaerolineae bacterium]